MITDADLGAAQTAIERAAEDLKNAEQAPPERWAGELWTAARGRLSQAQAALTRLRKQQTDEQAELAARPDIEKSAAKYISAAAKDLDASRTRIATAANAVQADLVELLDAVAAHNGLVYQDTTELAALGLMGVQGVDHQTSGAVVSGRPELRIRGTWWPSVEASTLVAWVVHRVAVARLGRRHGLARHLLFFAGRYSFDRRTDGLLDAVAEVPALDVDLPTGRAAPFEPPRVGFRSDFDRQEAEKRAADAMQTWEATENGPRRVQA